MRRRTLLLAACPVIAQAQAQAQGRELGALERAVAGRLGFFALDTATGRTLAHRADERFAMASTFKALLACAVAQRVAAGRARWDDRIELRAVDRVPHAPVFDELLPRGFATVAELVDAILLVSDNPAANLLMRELTEGPAGLTRWLRSQGDAVTRLDRWEPELNANTAGDERDSTTPRALALTLKRLLLDGGLDRDGRARLLSALFATQTGSPRFRAALPDATWRMADKTGTGARGACNHAALLWPPGGRAPWVVVGLQSDSSRPTAELNAVLAQAMRHTIQRWS